MQKKLFSLPIACLISGLLFATEQTQYVSTIMVYMAGDNDLEVFIEKNLKQMMQVGSNQNHVFVAQVNKKDHKKGRKVSQTLKIEKGKKVVLNETSDANHVDGGDAQTLIDFCTEIIYMFPAQQYVLIFWNHGTGPLDPFTQRSVHTSDLFSLFNEPFDGCSQSLRFFDSVTIDDNQPHNKGICFDDSTGNFLTENKLFLALEALYNGPLAGKKFDIIGFDACLMAMVEVASVLKKYASFMVASQEVELGSGWDYNRAFSALSHSSPVAAQLGRHIVGAYAQTYRYIDDFTLSCIDLTFFGELEKVIESICTQLLEGYRTTQHDVRKLLQASRNKHSCTHFEEPDFIDLDHFLANMLQNVAKNSGDNEATRKMKAALKPLLAHARSLLRSTVIANESGSSFENAQGLSIYFPEKHIHRSYTRCRFATNTGWLNVLRHYFS